MTYETLTLAHEDGIRRITLNRPETLNAFTVRMHEDLAAALEDARLDADVRVIVLTGAGRGFCAGQDLGERQRQPGDPPHDLAEGIERRWNPLIRTLVSMPKPTIAAVNGVAAGAGANLAFACDIVIACESARFIQAFVNIGLAPDAGGTWHLPRLCGLPRALGLTMLGQPIHAVEAAAWGLIWHAAPDADFEAEVAQVARRLARLPPQSLAAIKQSLRHAFERTLDQQLEIERDQQQRLGFSNDYAEGVSAFKEKRVPRFSGA